MIVIIIAICYVCVYLFKHASHKHIQEFYFVLYGQDLPLALHYKKALQMQDTWEPSYSLKQNKKFRKKFVSKQAMLRMKIQENENCLSDYLLVNKGICKKSSGSATAISS